MTKKQVRTFIFNKLRSKYVFVFLLFLTWLFFFDQNAIWDRMENQSRIEELKKEKNYYLRKIESDKKKIHELKTNKKNLEKFAREQYLMKKEDEDIFIVLKK